jgi:hypothetical protein
MNGVQVSTRSFWIERLVQEDDYVVTVLPNLYSDVVEVVENMAKV